MLDLGIGAVIVVRPRARGHLDGDRRRRCIGRTRARSPPRCAGRPSSRVPSDSPRMRPRFAALLRSTDVRDVRLGLDLLAGVASEAAGAELQQLADHADPEVRVRALVELAARGDAGAAAQVAAARRPPRRSRRTVGPARRCRGDRLSRASSPPTEPSSSASSAIRTATVRAAALDAVAPDDGADDRVIRHVVAAVGRASHRRNRDRCTPAARRAGDPVPRRRARPRRAGPGGRASSGLRPEPRPRMA